MTATAQHIGEEVNVTFTAESDRYDYGPGTITETEVNPDSIAIHSLTILGVDCDPRTLPADLLIAVHALAQDAEFA
ncbi:MAG: hypothetical protein II336_17935 [Loktanella sp.]|nr:hypothetical protein [Loktanella sp.]